MSVDNRKSQEPSNSVSNEFLQDGQFQLNDKR